MFYPIKNTKVYEQVIEQIKQMVDDGTLKKGDKLPSERDLVEQLNVSRASIREALKALEVIGLIDCKQGEGNYIKTSFEDNLFEPLSIMFMLEESDPESIWELRKIMEVEAAGLASKRINNKDLKELKELTERFLDLDNEEIHAEIDKKFHYKIAKCCGNILIYNILKTLSNLVDHFIKDIRKSILVDKGNKEILFSQHHNIYLSMESHDSKAARKAMGEHFDFANKYMNK
ncbi:FadR/GntR family transcriptional regulator [Clostridium algidicarnis]|uniref:FadR/GntR family transcriptional regulator n=1 Tax=Clostridium algidicarnis TaxID=37659 RepID=UPI00049811AE|nr:FadR/GntR family transcriptional regulator [Clostridium algidicarnis]MBB6696577.1 FadR family transcriptional regulator [Clostridium algidicarnis]MBU3202794.1 FadR family transcriptional regulator [Clostridium algidicarnis]MBU3205900.1 FadR family transcriptional regulator [Clostridium algidicarnis]MBU3210948.1 FadR family transcriptional regulator [Clostridium algidicarnis]MBU3222544.1 FadR family transcriptional regulator [Clostridium algidicarnis]